MGRGSSRLGVLMVVGAVAACAPPAERPAPLPTPTIGSAAPSPSLTPPSPDPLVSEYSPAGATAFVQYYFDVYNYALITGRTEELRSLQVSECKTCTNFVNGISDVWSTGRASGGTVNLENAGTPEFQPSQPTVLSFASYATSTLTVFDRAGATKMAAPPERGRLVITLSRQADRWLVTEVQREAS